MSSGGGGSTTTTQTQSGPPPQVMQAYEGLVGAASNVASQPLQQYTDPMVAGFTPQQQAGFQTIDNAQGIGFPYINAAAQQYGQATAPLWQGLPQFDTSALPNYGNTGIQNAFNTAFALPGVANTYANAAAGLGQASTNTATLLPGQVSPYTAAAADYGHAQGTVGNAAPGAVAPGSNFAMGTAGNVANIGNGLQGQARPYQDFGTGSANSMSGIAGGLQGGAQPYQNYGTGSADNMGGIAGNLQGDVSPYTGFGYGQAGDVADISRQVSGGVSPYQAAASRGIRLPGYNTLDTYLSPYTKNVTSALQDLFNQQNAEQFQQIRGNAATQGAYGGDREAVAEAITARQQQLGEAPALSQALQSGFAQAQNELNNQQNLQLQRQQAERQLSLGAGQLGLSGYQTAGQLAGQAGQLGLSAGQLGLGAGTAAGQLYGQQGQLGLSAGQLGLGAGTAAGQLYGQAGQLGLGAGQLGLGAGTAAGNLGIGAGNLGIGSGNLNLAGLNLQGQLYNNAGQMQLGAGNQRLATGMGQAQLYNQAGQTQLGAGQLATGALGQSGQLGLSGGQAGYGEFNTQQAQQLAADQANRWLASQAGFGMASLGNQALSQALTGANAEIGAGALQQQLAQEQLNIPYQQFLQAQAYPYQQLSFLSPIVEGTGSLSGGKGSTTYPGPSALSQIGGLGAAATGLSGLFGSGSSSGSDFNSAGFGGSGGDFGGGFDPSSVVKTGGRIGYARGGTTPDVPGIGNGVPILDLSYIPTETDKPVGSSLGIGIGAGGSQTTSSGGGGGGSLLGGIGQAVGAVKTAVDVGSAIGIGDVLGGLFFLKDGGRAGFALGGDTSDPTQVDPTQSDPTKLNTSKWALPKVPQINLDHIMPPKNAGPAVKQGKGPPDLQAMPQQMPGQPQDSGLKGIGDLGKSLKSTNLFGSSDDSSSSDGADKGYAGGGVPLSAAINFGGGSPGQSMQVDELRKLPLERLYEMSVRFPQNTPQGQMVARVLNEKRMTPGEGTAPTGAPAQAGASPGGGMGMGGGYGAASAPAAGGMGGQPDYSGGTSHLAHGGEADEEPGFVTEDMLDPHPIVDHSGDSVVIRYPSEGKTLDLGLPSIKHKNHYAAGGAAAYMRQHYAKGGGPGLVDQDAIQSTHVPLGDSFMSHNGVAIPLLPNASFGNTEGGNAITRTAGNQTLAPGGGLGNWFQAVPQRTQFGTGPGGSTMYPNTTAFTPGMASVINGLTKGKGTIPPEFGGALPGSTPPVSATQSQDDINNAIFQQFLGSFGTPDSGGNRRGGRIGYAEGGEMDDPSEAPPPREREPDDSGLTALAREQRQLATPDLADVVKSRAVRSVVRDPPPESREEVVAPKRPAGMRSPLTDSLSLDDLLDKYERTKPPGEGYADIPPPEDRPTPDHREFAAAVPGRDTREFTAAVPGIGSPATAPIPVARKDEDFGAGAYEMWQKPGSGFTDPLSGEVLHAPPGGEGLGDHMPDIGKALKSIYSPEQKLAMPEGPPMMTQPTNFVAKPDGIGAPATAEAAPGLGQPAKPAQFYRDGTRLADITGGHLRLPGPFQSLTTAATPTPPAAAAPPPSNVTRVTSPAKVAQFPEPAKETATPAAVAPSGVITPLNTDVVIGGKVWRDGTPIGPAAPKAAAPAPAPTPPVTRVTSPPQVTGAGKPYTPATPEGKQAAAETAPTGGSTVEFGGAVPAVVHPAQGYYQGEAAKFTGGNPGNWMGVGDSLAVRYIRNAGLGGTAATLKTDRGAADADAAGGRSPQEVLDAIRAHPERYQGKNILLSGGVSNDPSQVSLVPQQIKALQDARAAKIRVLGVGNREGDEGGQHYNLAPHNAQLEQYAKGEAAGAASPAGDNPNAKWHTQAEIDAKVPPGQGSGSSRPGNGPVTPDLAKQAGYGKDPEGYAELANYLWKGEASDFNILYGNTRFTSGYDKHPADKGWQGGYGPAGPTHAAGLPQFQPATWHGQAEKLGLNDFSPVNQVKGGLDLAETVYRNQTGGDLLTDFKAGKLDQINGALHSTWTSLGTGSVAAPPRDGAGAGSGGSGGGPRQPGPGQPDEVIADKNGKPVVTPAGQTKVDDYRSNMLNKVNDPREKSALAKWMDSPSFLIFMIGAGMLASRSPFPGVALGEGLLAAGKSVQEVRKDQNREDLAEARVNALAGRVSDAHSILALREKAIAQKGESEAANLQIKQAAAAATIAEKQSKAELAVAKFHLAEAQAANGKVKWEPGPGPDPDDPTKTVQGSWKMPLTNDGTPEFFARVGAPKAAPASVQLIDHKKQMYLDLHPGDEQGAVEFAAGRKTMSPADYTKMVQTQENKLLNEWKAKNAMNPTAKPPAAGFTAEAQQRVKKILGEAPGAQPAAAPPATPGNSQTSPGGKPPLIQNGWQYDPDTHQPIGPAQ